MARTPPTYVDTYWQGSAGDRINSTLPKTVAVTCAEGDYLTAWSIMADNAATVSTPTGGSGLTWTLVQGVSGIASYSGAYVWRAGPVPAGLTSFNLQTTKTGGSGTFMWVFACSRWSGSDGIGASNKKNAASGAPSITLTTQQANSAVLFVNADWNAAAHNSRAYTTATAGAFVELFYERDVSTSSTLSGEMGYHPDAGVAGAKTLGMNTSQKYSTVVVEVLGREAATGSGFFPFFGMPHHADDELAERRMRRTQSGLYVPDHRPLARAA